MKRFRTSMFLYGILLGSLLRAQNLVPNPSFENYTSCPTSTEFFKLSPWCGLSGGEDSYNVCFNSVFFGPGGFGIPYTAFGFQYPRTGNGIGSVIIIPNGSGVQDRREYLHVPLTTTLSAGKTYCGSMYLNLYNESRYTTDKVGMYFSATPYACNQAMPVPQYIAPLNVIPQIANASGNFIRDTLNWTEVSGTFVANGTEQYLTIGNFYNDVSTATVVANYPSAYTVTIFLIDDVSLEEVIPAQAIADATICAGDSVALGITAGTEFATYNWQPATGLSCTGCANPKASPQSTGTYTLTKQQCHTSTTATVRVAVDANCDASLPLPLPNVFTPNGDGANDTFQVQLHAGVTQVSFEVYNRWGLEVFSLQDPSHSSIRWDGRTTAGEACVAGVYYYIISYSTPKGEQRKTNGYLSLFR